MAKLSRPHHRFIRAGVHEPALVDASKNSRRAITPGIKTGALTFKLSSGPMTVQLTRAAASNGTALLSISPPSLMFDGYVVGDNPDQIGTVSNPDGVTAGIRSISATGASFTIDVTSKPMSVGSY